MRNERARGITADGKPIFSEAHEHTYVAAWLDSHKIFWAHPANGELRHPVVAKRLKRMGVKPGIPDFLIFDKPPREAGCVGAALELKALDGGKPRPAQADFMDNLVQRGWMCGWHRGADAAIRWLESLGYGAR